MAIRIINFDDGFTSATAPSSSNFDSISYSHVATPSTPAASTSKLYFKADNALYRLNSSGVESMTGASMGRVTTASGARAITSDEQTIVASTGGGGFTLTLPAANTVTGQIYKILKDGDATNILVLDGNGAETIGPDDTLTKEMYSDGETMTLVSNGSKWHILDRYIPSEYTRTQLTSGTAWTVTDDLWYDAESTPSTFTLNPGLWMIGYQATFAYRPKITTVNAELLISAALATTALTSGSTAATTSPLIAESIATTGGYVNDAGSNKSRYHHVSAQSFLNVSSTTSYKLMHRAVANNTVMESRMMSADWGIGFDNPDGNAYIWAKRLTQ